MICLIDIGIDLRIYQVLINQKNILVKLSFSLDHIRDDIKFANI